MNPAATESATGSPPLERSRVAPEVNPIGGGIVTDEQSGAWHGRRAPAAWSGSGGANGGYTGGGYLGSDSSSGSSSSSRATVAWPQASPAAPVDANTAAGMYLRHAGVDDPFLAFVPLQSSRLTAPAGTSPGDGKTLGTKLNGVEMDAAREYAEAEAARHGQVPNLNRIDGAEGQHQPTFKDRVAGYAKIAAGKTFNNPAEVAYGKAKLEGDL